MQLQIKFQFEKQQDWKFDKNILQGIFYNAIKSLNIENTHNKEIWSFTFSNIYPFEKNIDFKSNITYNITFRTIRKDILLAVSGFFLMNKEIIFWKENKLFIKNVSLVNNEKIYSWKIIKWVNPIVLSLDKKLANKYWIEYNVKDKKPLYWNKNMWFNIFQKQLNKNIIKKYIYILQKIFSWEWNSNNLEDNVVYYFRKIESWEKNLLDKYQNKEEFDKFIENIDLFKGYKFKYWALLNYKRWKIAGSYWDFIVWENTEDLDKTKILKIVSLIWIWERTTAGFGFIK